MNTLPTHTPEGESIFSVSELNTTIRQLLELNFAHIYVSGEVSNLSRPASGHLYFSLKDSRAQVRCAWFRGKQLPGNFLKDGMQVIAKASASLYPDRGDYQLIIEQVIDAGKGLLMQQFEALKQKLTEQGLFDSTHKRPLPDHITTVGVITSDSGAALHDILTVLNRRFPAIQVILYASQVQGEAAPEQLIKALRFANQQKACDILLLARGGGSLEDLWAFNNETLAHAIYNSQIPVISAVGHEVDFTIADFVADLRAPTPSAAAEMVSPDGQALLKQNREYQRYLEQWILRVLQNHNTLLLHLGKRLKHPGQILQDQSQRLDLVSLRLNHFLTRWFDEKNNQLDQIKLALTQQIKSQLLAKQNLLKNQAQMLHALSPLNTLSRGYTLVKKIDGGFVKKSNEIKHLDKIEVIFSDGKIRALVQS